MCVRGAPPTLVRNANATTEWELRVELPSTGGEGAGGGVANAEARGAKSGVAPDLARSRAISRDLPDRRACAGEAARWWLRTCGLCLSKVESYCELPEFRHDPADEGVTRGGRVLASRVSVLVTQSHRNHTTIIP